jgi:hypothetical protein
MRAFGRRGQIDAMIPLDQNDSAIQVLAPEESTVTTCAIGAGNARAAIPTGAAIVEVSLSASAYFGFGNSAVDVTSGTWRLLHKGVYVYRIPTGATHYAATQYAGSTGAITVGRLQ